MSLRDANLAAMPVKMLENPSVKCMTLSALPAERIAKFLFSLGMIALYIAANVFQTKDNFFLNSYLSNTPFRRIFFIQFLK
jgi:hypothetical protein